MAPQYASTQPKGFKNHIENIAIVGAGGQQGKFITEYILKAGTQHLTALTRDDSTSKLPSGIKEVKVNYDDQSTLVSALSGIDALIITLSVTAPPDTQSKLIRAAATAKVPWVFPNEYGTDGENEQLGKEIMYGPACVAARKEIEELGVSSWVAITCGFWYEYSLSGGVELYGFDFGKREVIYFDDGEEKTNTSTWPQCGRAVAKLLSLKVLPEGEGDEESVTLSRWRNKHAFISSFLVNQKDVFESVKRVTGTKEGDWTIRHEASKDRYESGIELMKTGDRWGFARAMYSRVFYPTGEGNYEAKRGLDNKVLGLPVEDIDEFTQIAVEKSQRGGIQDRH